MMRKCLIIGIAVIVTVGNVITGSHSNVSAAYREKTETPPSITPTPVTTYKREMRRVAKAETATDDAGETVYIIRGNESWRRTDIEIKSGQKVEISASGLVRWAPDGIEKIDVTPDGTRPPYRGGWNYYHFPYPEAGIGSLVMRIGRGVYAVGSSKTIESEDQGYIEFMVNDDVLDDNSGYFAVKVRVQPLPDQ